MGDPLPEVLVEFAPEAIVHLAWEGIPDFGRERCLKNLTDQAAFFRSVLTVSPLRRVVVAGTCSEYGDLTGRSPGMIEVSPVDDFGRAKDALHRMLRAACDKSQVDLIWFRIFYVYGPGQRRESLIPSILHQLRSGRDAGVSNPDNAHDFVFVSDVAAAFRLAVESQGGPAVVDLGSGDLHRVREVLNTAMAEIGKRQPASEKAPQAATGLKANLVASEALGWTPIVDLAEGIHRMVVADWPPT